MIKNPEPFPSFMFTEGDLIAALSFTDVQRGYLQTELAAKQQLRLALRFDPTAAHEFIQQEAYLIGQMELLVELLTPLPPPEAQLDNKE